MKTIIYSRTVCLLIALSFVAVAGSLFAATYYVDFESGIDSRLGTSPGQSWQHCPGDAAATNAAKSKIPQPGDVFIFKGGVKYPGGFSLAESSGTITNPIIYDGNTAGTFGTGSAIISGARNLTNWVRCTSQADAGGATNWQDCFAADITGSGITEPWMVNLFYDDNVRGVVARKPNMTVDPLWWNDATDLQPVADADITSTTLNIPADFAAPPGENWAGAYAGTWTEANHVQIRNITATSADGTTLTLTSFPPRSKHDNKFVLIAHPRLLDVRGEFVLVNTNRLIFYAGPGGAAPVSAIISAIRNGININWKSHYVFQGLTFANFSGSTTDTRGGIGIGSYLGGSAVPTNIVIRNCTFRDNHSIKGNGTVFFGMGEQITIDHCLVKENQSSRGIQAGGCNNVVISNNELDRNGGTGIYISGTDNSLIIGNKVTRHLGMHANGITIYQGSTNVAVMNNIVTRGLIALTIQSSQNVTLSYNVFTTDIVDGTAFSIWGQLNGYDPSWNVTIRNNVIFCNAAGEANSLGNSDPAATSLLRIYNNIIHGSGIAPTNVAEMHNNLYTGLTWTQNSKYKWVLEPGSVVATNGEPVFVNAASYDYRIAAGSPAIDAGTDWGQTNDIAGNLIGGAAPDMGAYEYTAAPSADFTVSTNSGAAPLAVIFTDTSTGTITNRTWNFGDGFTTNTTATSVAHTYTVAGTNTVQLIVSGPLGSSTNTQIGAITVTLSPAPVASFSASPTSGVASLAVTFTDTSTGTITNRFWSFGDGSTTNTTAASFIHTYTSAGTNTVRLIVSGAGVSSTNTQVNLIRVADASQGILLVEDHFDYVTTNLTGNMPVIGGTWGGSGSSVILGSGLGSPGGFAEASGNEIKIGTSGSAQTNQFATINSGTVYMSYLIQFNSLRAGAMMWGGLSLNGAAEYAQLQYTNTTGNSYYQLGLGGRSTVLTTNWLSTQFTAGQTQLVVVAYTFVSGAANDIMSLWINPNSSTFGAGSAPAADLIQIATTEAGSLNTIDIKNSSTLPANTILDEMRVGTAWASVVPAASSAPPGDVDSDGIPDGWEVQHFGGVTNASPSALAANGVNTIYETYIAGLNPTNPSARFSVSNDRNVLGWNATSGRVYSVYWTTNLLNGFQPLATNIVWPQGSWTDLVHGAEIKNFYQIKVRLSP
jgi:parallel beta-helix repeat protein